MTGASVEERWEAATARLRGQLEPMVAVTPSLRRSVATLTEQYRDGSAAAVASGPEVDAYLATRMPATMAAAGAAMRAVAMACPDFAPRTQVDVGAGAGSSLWAALAIWPALEAATAVERSDAMIARGRALASGSGWEALASSRWVQQDVRRAALVEADLVTAAYLLGEVGDGDRAPLVERLWRSTAPDGVLLLVDAGSAAGFERIRAARAQLIGAGATIAAPCPHDAACPMRAPDWCHFGVRLARSRLHRQAKGADLPYEDEPYAYVAATRRTVVRGARVLRRPDVRSGAIGLRLCTLDGIRDRTVRRRDGPAFREARHAGWGASVEP